MPDPTPTPDPAPPADRGHSVAGKVAAVTGAASGIGRALAHALAAAGAAGVALSDVDGPGVEAVAAEVTAATGVPTFGATVDVSNEADLVAFIDRTEAELGPVDLWCGNAGILVIGGPEVPDADWARIHAVNVMAHVYASRALVPRMLGRGGGTILLTVSAAGLLTQIGSAPYSVTKHAALGLAEWLSITYGDRGLRVHALCPQAVATGMTAGIEGGGVAGIDGMLTADAVAAAALDGLDRGDLLILPHPEVAEYARRRAGDHERWLRGMRRLQAAFAAFTLPDPSR